MTGTEIAEIDIWKYMRDAGDRPVPEKPQYVRGGWIFTCPKCGTEINSYSYLNVGYFQIACETHVENCKGAVCSTIVHR